MTNLPALCDEVLKYQADPLRFSSGTLMDLARALKAAMEREERYREALKPFADYAEQFWPNAAGDRVVMGITKDIAVRAVSVGDLRRAKSALDEDVTP